MFSNRTELMIQLTYACNLNCTHCSYGDLKKGEYLTPFKVKDFLSRNKPELIKLSGGEPLLAPFYGKILALCKSTGAKVVSFTNGLGNPYIHPDEYWVSIYGNEYWYEKVTGSKNYFQVLEFIKAHKVAYLCSPVFNDAQVMALRNLGELLGIPLRLTRLLKHGLSTNPLSLKEQQEIIRKYKLDSPPNVVTCSLGFQEPKCSLKACLKPDGTEIECTAMIRGLKCPFYKEV